MARFWLIFTVTNHGDESERKAEKSEHLFMENFSIEIENQMIGKNPSGHDWIMDFNTYFIDSVSHKITSMMTIPLLFVDAEYSAFLYAIAVEFDTAESNMSKRRRLLNILLFFLVFFPLFSNPTIIPFSHVNLQQMIAESISPKNWIFLIPLWNMTVPERKWCLNWRRLFLYVIIIPSL